jgi:Zn-dependent peptidase ImmA (M78 family)/DNA-binding XRE family transcriptional regulator
MNSVGGVLTTARIACGRTQEELASVVGITQAALSRYENAMREPEPEVLGRLASALGVTVPFLLAAGKLHGAMAVEAHMRRRKTAKPTDWRRLEARLNMYRMHARYLHEEVLLRAEQRVPTFDPLDAPPSDAARLVRMQWRMPIGPAQTLVQWLEAAGCIVIEEDFGRATRVDGLSQWIDECPVILLNARAPTDRKRLTLAHELGHLCLHSEHVAEDMEDQANAFAAEFLMPASIIRPQLRNLSIGKLLDLKREWGVSVQALIERAREVRGITDVQRTSLYKALSYRGWRTAEPISDELLPEKPRLPEDIGNALASRGLSLHEIAALVGVADPDGQHPFRPTGPKLRAV